MLKTRRAVGQVWWGTRAARCLAVRADRAGGGREPRTLFPETPRSLTLPRAEQKRQNSGGAHGEPGAPSSLRSGAGHGGHPCEGWLDARCGAGYRGTGAEMGWSQSLGVRPTVGPPTSLAVLSWDTAVVAAVAAALSCARLYTPDPGNDVIGPPPVSFPHPSGGPDPVRSTSQPHPSCPWCPAAHSSWVGQRGRHQASRWWHRDPADPPPLDGSTDLLCVLGQGMVGLWASCSSSVRALRTLPTLAHHSSLPLPPGSLFPDLTC